MPDCIRRKWRSSSTTPSRRSASSPTTRRPARSRRRARGGSTRFIDVDGPRVRSAARGGAAGGRAGRRSATDAAWLFYTSGTTGRPKGVVLTHGNLLAMTLNYLADVDHAAVGDHLLHAAPMSHGSGLYAIPNIAAGATQLIPAARGFDLDEIRQVLAWTPNVKFFAAPTMVMRLVDAIGDAGEPANLKSIIYGGGPDVRRRQPPRARLLRPAAGADLRPGRGPDDDHRASGRGSLRRSRRPPARAARLGGPGADGRRTRGARPGRRAGCGRRDRRGLRAGRRRDGGLPEQPAGDRGHAGQRLAAHRRPRPARRTRLPDAGRPQQGPHHLGRLEHLPARGRGGAAAAPGDQGSGDRRRAGSRVGRGRGGGGREEGRPHSRPAGDSTSSAWNTSPASSGPSAMSSSTNFRRTPRARC